jgi:hypothetical protein
MFLFYTAFKPVVVPTQPPAWWVPGSSKGLGQPGHDADHSPSPSDEVKNVGAMPSLPTSLHGMVLI